MLDNYLILFTWVSCYMQESILLEKAKTISINLNMAVDMSANWNKINDSSFHLWITDYITLTFPIASIYV